MRNRIWSVLLADWAVSLSAVIKKGLFLGTSQFDSTAIMVRRGDMLAEQAALAAARESHSGGSARSKCGGAI